MYLFLRTGVYPVFIQQARLQQPSDTKRDKAGYKKMDGFIYFIFLATVHACYQK